MRMDAESNLNDVAISYPQVVRRFSKELGTIYEKLEINVQILSLLEGLVLGRMRFNQQDN